MKTIIPPIKCQGIKTKLVPSIKQLASKTSYQRWIEPFVGSGVVAFNILPKEALLCDSNPHIIAFYRAIQDGAITPEIARLFLKQEGESLSVHGEDYYYEVRNRFNQKHSPLDFLFLNRACFNGIMRFNSKGQFNVPFCRKENRFSSAYITKITNQIATVQKAIQMNHYVFACQDFKTTISSATGNDFLYCDPPYIDRYADYFNQWTGKDEMDLLSLLRQTSAKFILSTWKSNIFRSNNYAKLYSEYFQIWTLQHFYHVGGSLENRHGMEEALIFNYDTPYPMEYHNEAEQLALSL